MATKISEQFGCRPDTLRKRLVNALHRRYRQQVPSEELSCGVQQPRRRSPRWY
jgi:hypothetical protein